VSPTTSEPGVEHLLFHVGRVVGLDDLAVQDLEDGLRVPAGREDAVPHDGLDAREAGFGRGRHVG